MNVVVWVDAHRGAAADASIAHNGVVPAVIVTIESIILIIMIAQAAFGVQ